MIEIYTDFLFNEQSIMPSKKKNGSLIDMILRSGKTKNSTQSLDLPQTSSTPLNMSHENNLEPRGAESLSTHIQSHIEGGLNSHRQV